MMAFRFLFFVMLLAGASTLAASAQAGAPLWIACSTAYDSGDMSSAISICNAATTSLQPDMPRLRAILAHAPPHTIADQEFAIDRGIRVLQVDFTKAKLTRKIGDDALTPRFSHDAAVWAINLNAMLQANDPMHRGAVYARYGAVISGFMQALDAFDPGIIRRELAAGRVRAK